MGVFTINQPTTPDFAFKPLSAIGKTFHGIQVAIQNSRAKREAGRTSPFYRNHKAETLLRAQRDVNNVWLGRV